MLRHMWQCVLLSTLVASTAGAAETGTWRPIGPQGGNFSAVAVDPDDAETAYALSNSRAFRRAGSSGRWQGLDLTYATAVAVAKGGRVYVAGNALYRSRNHGKAFERIALPERFVVALAVDPSDADILYGAFEHGIRRSDDGGDSWSEVSVPVHGDFSGFDIFAVTIDPDTRSTIYIATHHYGVFVSDDAGMTWTARSDGLPCKPVIEQPCLTSFALVPDGKPTLLVAAYEGRLYRSGDDDTWTPALESVVTALTATRSTTLFAGVASDPGFGPRPSEIQFDLLRSDDAGQRWRQVDDKVWPRAVTALAVKPDTDDLLYVGTGAVGLRSYGNGIGLLRRNGNTWQLDQTELYGSCAYRIAATATSMTSLITAVDLGDGLFASGDGGTNWHGPNLDARFVEDLATDPNDPSHAYATADGPGLISTSDAGESWVGNALSPPHEPEDLVVDARDSSTLYGIRQAPPAYGRAVWKSRDAGETWTLALSATAGSGQLVHVAVDVASGAVYALADHALFRSRDAGEHWEQIATSPSDQEYWSELTVAPTSPPTLLRIGNTGLAISSDDGATWLTPDIPAPYGARYVHTAAVDPSRAMTFYTAAFVGDGSYQVFRSDDAGVAWAAVGDPVPFDVSALAVDPHNRRVLYAATCASVQMLTQASSTTGGGDTNGCAITSTAAPSGRLIGAHALALGLLMAARRYAKRRVAA